MSIYHSKLVNISDQSAKQSGPVDRAIAYMIENYSETISLVDIARASGISKYGLIRRFHQQRHQTPMKWLWSYRILRSINLMQKHPDFSVKQIAYISGFLNQSHYSRVFKQRLKLAPAFYRRSVIESGLSAIHLHHEIEDSTDAKVAAATNLTGKLQAFNAAALA